MPGRRRYEIQLTSRSGPIDVFLIQDTPSSTTISENRSAVAAPQPKGSLPVNNDDLLASTHLLMHHADPEIMKHFDLPGEGYNFELKPGEVVVGGGSGGGSASGGDGGTTDLQGCCFTDMFDAFNNEGPMNKL